MERKLKKRNKEAVILRKESGLITQSASKSFEEKGTERITKTNADEAVMEAETERESLTAEINGLKQRLNEVMGQT